MLQLPETKSQRCIVLNKDKTNRAETSEELLGALRVLKPSEVGNKKIGSVKKTSYLCPSHTAEHTILSSPWYRIAVSTCGMEVERLREVSKADHSFKLEGCLLPEAQAPLARLMLE